MASTCERKSRCAGIEKLENSLRGRLILPGDPGYDEARAVWNGRIDRQLALIVRCSGAADL